MKWYVDRFYHADLAVLALVALLFSTNLSSAADWHVKQMGSDSATGATWEEAFKTIQKAIAVARAGDSILVSAGTYYADEGPEQTDNSRSSTFMLPDGIAMVGGYDPVGSGLRDEVLFQTILSGDIEQNDESNGIHGNAYNVVTAKNVSASLDGFIITKGHADKGHSSSINLQKSGAGVLVTSASLKIKSCRFVSNVATISGGAIFSQRSSVEVVDTVFLTNLAKAGGAITNLQAAGRITRSVFMRNQAVSSSGGAIYNSTESSPTIKDCQFYGNVSGVGGGGAITNYWSSSPRIVNCAFINNRAPQSQGGAIFNENNPETHILVNCVFRGNSSFVGGALYNSATALSIINCTFRNNAARWRGGAIHNVSSSLFLGNCIVWRNSSLDSTDTLEQSVANFQTRPTFRHCLIHHWAPPNLEGDGNLDGTDDRNEPQFASDTDLRLMPSSPCLDAGLNILNIEEFDQRGRARIQGNKIDLGAFEGGAYDIIWNTDQDQDGFPWGVEQAMGTDLGGGREGFSLMRPIGLGPTAIRISKSPNAVPGTVWILMRSEDLDDFEEVWRYDGRLQDAIGISSSLNSGEFLILDEKTGVPRAFYEFRAQFVE